MNLEKVPFGFLITSHFSSLFSLIKIVLFRRMNGWEGWGGWHVPDRKKMHSWSCFARQHF